MRIGVDVQVLFGHSQAGIYVYIWNLLAALEPVVAPHRLWLFAHQFTRQSRVKRAAEIERAFPSASQKSFFWPQWAYRIRMRMAAINRVSVFHHTSGLAFPPSSAGANVFTIPDLVVHHLPQLQPADTCDRYQKLLSTAQQHEGLILTYSEHTKKDVVNTLQIPEERVHVVPLAPAPQFRLMADREEVGRGLERFGLRGTPYILSVGTLEPRKNHVALLEAFARLRRRRPDLPHKLVLAGGRGWLYDGILMAIGRLGLEDQVVLPGHAEPLEVLYNGAEVLVYPSLYEGFGLPPLEAMACGTPVIVSDSSSLPEVVGDAGLLVDPRDVDGLGDALEAVLSDAGLRRRLREAGLRRAAQFSWERTARETLAVYEKAHRMASRVRV
jgi:glycosyltransferase involved in cell wall biosynthesis